ncbi:MAG: N-terminal phage integrase SAM-like domain-containing protein [Dysosmobacter sp.]
MPNPASGPTQRRTTTNHIENHIVPGIGNIPLDKLTTIQIQRFYNNLQKADEFSAKTSLNSGTKVSAPEWCGASTHCCTTALEQAVAERLILANPAQGCKLPQLEKGK